MHYQKKIQKKQKKTRTSKYIMKKSITVGAFKLRLLFGFGVGLFIRLQPANVFEPLVKYPFDLAIYTSKFILSPLLEGFVSVVIDSYDKAFLRAHANLL